jgi:hypothetical protein
MWRLVACLALLAAHQVPAWVDPTPVEILALGQHIEGLGTLSAFTHTLCLGADGRVGAGVIGGDGQRALACGDASGFTAIIRQGDPSPRGGVFVDFPDCAMPADGFVYFAATRLDPQHGQPIQDVYRATPDGIEWIIGPGAIATDGALIRQLDPLILTNVVGARIFQANDRGTVLVRAEALTKTIFARVRFHGLPETMSSGNGIDAGLAGDDTVLALAYVPPANRRTIAALNGDQKRVLFTLADIGADLGLIDPINLTLETIMVRGVFFILQFEYWTMASPCASDDPEECPTEDHGGFVLYSPTRGFMPIVDPTLYDDVWVIDLTTEGSALIAALKDRPFPNFSDNVVVDDSGVHLISRDLGIPLSLSNALALNNRGNVLLQNQLTPDVSPAPTGLQPVATPTPTVPSDPYIRQDLALTGPAPEVRCFIPPTAIEPSALPTETEIPAPTATPTVDCTVQTDACASLHVGSVTGVPGGLVTVEVTLNPGLWSVVGVEGDLQLLEQAPVATTQTGDPACRVNPAIGKPESRFAFQPAGCGADCTHVRALVLAFGNLDPLPTGVPIFTCDLAIAANTAPGAYPLTLADAGASDAHGGAIPIGSTAGTLTVNRVNGNGGSLSAANATGGHGCHVGPSGGDPGWPTLVFAALVVGLRLTRPRRMK